MVHDDFPLHLTDCLFYAGGTVYLLKRLNAIMLNIYLKYGGSVFKCFPAS